MTDVPARLVDAYLDLLKRSLLGLTVGRETYHLPREPSTRRVPRLVRRIVEAKSGAALMRPVEFDPTANADGTASVWELPPWCMTMVGLTRLNNVEACIRDVIEAGVPGDLIETGVWRGGTATFMRGVLHAYDVSDRSVYVADSFEGLPPPNIEKYPADEGLDFHHWYVLAVSVEEVRANFDRYGLLDEQVHFVKGWFRDTLPQLRDHTWAVLRLDGDLYESTMDALENLYPGLSPGGWVIVDDYDIEACAQAVEDYRQRERITEPIVPVDWTGICWRKLG